MVVIHHANRTALHMRRNAVSEYAPRAHEPFLSCSMRAPDRYCTSEKVTFRPLAPVGDTTWAASPARNSRQWPIGSATKLRSYPSRSHTGQEGGNTQALESSRIPSPRRSGLATQHLLPLPVGSAKPPLATAEVTFGTTPLPA